MSQGSRFIGKALLEARAGLDDQNEKGETALVAAAMTGQNDLAIMLIESGADVNLADNTQKTALAYASERGFAEIVEQLLMAGAEGCPPPQTGTQAKGTAARLRCLLL